MSERSGARRRVVNRVRRDLEESMAADEWLIQPDDISEEYRHAQETLSS